MFSFFKRSKSRNNSANTNTNNTTNTNNAAKNHTTVASATASPPPINPKSALQQQQSSLQQVLDQRNNKQQHPESAGKEQEKPKAKPSSELTDDRCNDGSNNKHVDNNRTTTPLTTTTNRVSAERGACVRQIEQTEDPLQRQINDDTSKYSKNSLECGLSREDWKRSLFSSTEIGKASSGKLTVNVNGRTTTDAPLTIGSLLGFKIGNTVSVTDANTSLEATSQEPNKSELAETTEPPKLGPTIADQSPVDALSLPLNIALSSPIQSSSSSSSFNSSHSLHSNPYPTYNSFFDIMARGRNKNRHRNNNYNKNHNQSHNNNKNNNNSDNNACEKVLQETLDVQLEPETEMVQEATECATNGVTDTNHKCNDNDNDTNNDEINSVNGSAAPSATENGDRVEVDTEPQPCPPVQVNNSEVKSETSAVSDEPSLTSAELSESSAESSVPNESNVACENSHDATENSQHFSSNQINENISSNSEINASEKILSENSNDAINNITITLSDQEAECEPSRTSDETRTSVERKHEAHEHEGILIDGAAKLQRVPSNKRVTFAPSPPRSLASSTEDLEEDEDETLSEDIFYEADEQQEQEAAGDNQQKLRILSTVTSTSSDAPDTRFDTFDRDHDHAHAKTDDSSLHSLDSDQTNLNSDVVCAKIILSVDDNNKLPNSDNSDHSHAFNASSSSNENECTSDESSDHHKVDHKLINKPPYVMIGDEPVLLPDILVETNILDQQQQHQHVVPRESRDDDEKGDLKSPDSSTSGSSVELVDQMQIKIDEMCRKIDDLERDLTVRTWTIERLQSELSSANKEDEFVRNKLKIQDEEMDKIRQSNSDRVDEDARRYEKLENEYKETLEKLRIMQSTIDELKKKLSEAENESEVLRKEKQELLDRCLSEEKMLREVLDQVIEERKQFEAKWKHDFESLRNVNSDREEQLMMDCEWKIRQMMKACKEKVEKAEKEKNLALDKAQESNKLLMEQKEEMKILKTCESEVAQLRGLTNDQRDSLKLMTHRIEDLKSELISVNHRLSEEIENCKQVKAQCHYDICEKERQALNRIEIARGEIAMQWEERMLEEMYRMKSELEQIHLDERTKELDNQKEEFAKETDELNAKFKEKERELLDQIESLKQQVALKRQQIEDVQSETDRQLMENRMYIDRREREHQQELESQSKKFEKMIEDLKEKMKREQEEIEANFHKSMNEIKTEFARELTYTADNLGHKHKKELEEQWKQLVSEKEDALQCMESRHRIRMDDAEHKMSELIKHYTSEMTDLKEQFNRDKTRLDARDVTNAQEIDTLHRKCRCLTKLFEEMRMRYERRDPRPEDLRHIDELKNIVDSQERDICYLTEQLRELQLTHQQLLQQNLPPTLAAQHQQQQQQNNGRKGRNRKNNNNNNNNRVNNNSNISNNNQPQQQQLQQQQQDQKNLMMQQHQQQQLLKKQLLKSSCNVIYEENEELENGENLELRNGNDKDSSESKEESPDSSTNSQTDDDQTPDHVIQHQHVVSDNKGTVPNRTNSTSQESQPIPKMDSSDSIPESQIIPKVDSVESVPDQSKKLQSDGSIELSDAIDFEIVPVPEDSLDKLSFSENSKKIIKTEHISDANVIAVVSGDDLDLD